MIDTTSQILLGVVCAAFGAICYLFMRGGIRIHVEDTVTKARVPAEFGRRPLVVATPDHEDHV